MNSKKPMAIVLGLALVLSATSIITTNTAEASTTSDLVSPSIRGTSTVTVLDPLPGSEVTNKVVLHTGEKVTLNGKLMNLKGDTLSNMPVNIYALTPTPEQKLIGSAMTGIDGIEDSVPDAVDVTVNTAVTSIGGIDISMASPILGSKDAPVTIIEFGDFQCPKCYQWFLNEKPTIKSDYIDTEKAKLYFMDFTILGSDSKSAAEASYCADDQGKYWEYHSLLYSNQRGIQGGWASPSALKQFASNIGLDADKFNTCLNSGEHSDRVAHNMEVGISSGVQGTPSFFVIGPDGNVVGIGGPQPSIVFAKVIDQMLS